MFVEPVEPRYGYRIIDEPIEISDDSSAYRLGSPSDELVLAFLSGIPSELPKKIAARIYKTRNALVHHKSNTARLKERGIYHPFKDEAELSNEIPLMRFVAEAIIIKTATEI